MNMISILLLKDFKTSFKNLFVFSSVITVPILGFIFSLNPGMDPQQLAGMFAVLIVLNIYVAGANTTACLIAEEKEMKTLNTLKLANIKPTQIMISKIVSSGTILLVTSMISYFIMSGYVIMSIPMFLVIAIIHCAIALTIGFIIGIATKSQIIASSLAAAVGFFMLLITDIVYVIPLPDIAWEIVIRTAPFVVIRLLTTPGVYFPFAEDLLYSLLGLVVVFVVALVVYKKRSGLQ
ncbi:MAG: ABC transporter permease [Defluviitaleaceae bacterium]|nr:ABC transporter permease [Defluviitaleaceae bacterium]